MQHDPNRPEDVLKVDADEDGVGDDDAADALRYLVATKWRTVAQRKLRGLWGAASWDGGGQHVGWAEERMEQLAKGLGEVALGDSLTSGYFPRPLRGF